MIVAVALVAFIGIHKTGGIEEVWNRAVDGNRIFPPKYIYRNLIFSLIRLTTRLNLIFHLRCLSFAQMITV